MKEIMWWKAGILFGVIILFCAPCMWSYGSDRVLLRDISAITLQQGRMTTGRRSSPVPQLKCVGGSAGCNGFVPQTVQCRNVGFDGYDVQWECKADMDDSYRFGKVQVTCEGYDYPDDPYVLKGSCGLEYTIDFTDAGKSRNQNGWNNYNHGSTYLKHGDESSGSWFIVFIVVGAIVFLICKMSSADTGEQTDNNRRRTDSHFRSRPNPPHGGNQPPPYGFKPEYSQSGANYEPPPAYADATGTSTHTSSSTRTDNSNSSPVGGFWSGMGLGGIAGYLFGRRRNYHGYGYGAPGNYGWGNNYGTGYGSGWGSGGWGNRGGWGSSGWGNNRGWGSSWGSGTRTTYRGSSSSSSGTSRTASGFGGTSRR